MNENLTLLRKATEEIKRNVIGKDDIIIKILMTICAGGHILLEDIPGVGKTTIAVAFSKALGLEYNRMQFTSDVMPADVTGFNIPDRQTGKFTFRPGAVFCNLFLADEINRTSSKTQSALLECMEEYTVTVDGVTRALPSPFIVLATQNPTGSAGTQLLPESQLDRFMIKLSIGYPKVAEEAAILKAKSMRRSSSAQTARVMNAETILAIREAAFNIHVSDEMFDYIAPLTAATREDKRLELGVSPRGSIAAMKMAKCNAMFRGRDFVIPDDVRFIFADVCSHRVIAARNKGKVLTDEQVKGIINDIALQVPAPKV